MAKIQLPALLFLSTLPHSFLATPPFVKGGGTTKISYKTLMGGFFFEILVGGTKKGDSIFWSSSVGGTCQGWLIFP